MPWHILAMDGFATSGADGRIAIWQKGPRHLGRRPHWLRRAGGSAGRLPDGATLGLGQLDRHGAAVAVGG